MSAADETNRADDALRERLASMSEVILRINESLDFETVLQTVLDSARALTGARYGVIATKDEQGGLEAVLTSGTSAEEHRRLVNLPGGDRIFAHFTALADPVRVDEYGAYASSAELNDSLPITVRAGLCAPIRHQSRTVGVIFQGHDAEDRRFSSEDEEILVMFSSQAALIIANARRYRDEQRARADLETLVNTTPVGVAVYDAATGSPTSLNREAQRIADSLSSQGQTTEQLLEMISVRRADGRTISLQELSLNVLLSQAEPVRGEEIVLEVPDGRTVTVLLNATPIRSDAGEVESVVVAIQDMADAKESERLRADFLAMVSHELRAPLSSIKGSAATVLSSHSELDPAVVRQFFRIIEERADHMHGLVTDLLDVAQIETGELPVSPVPAEVEALVDHARSAFSSRGAENSLEIDIEPNLPLVLADRRRVEQVLGNLLANAARHSPRSSPIRVAAVRHGVHVAFSVADQGRGIPAESLPGLFRKFSRTRSPEQEEDTGLGLAICKGIVEAHGGRIWAESDGPDLGARFTFTLPTMAQPGSDSAAPGRASAGQRGESGEGPRVLVVDDDPRDLRNIRDTLAASGYQPVATGDPEEALQLMRDEEPQLALLDLMLPGADGVELMQDLQEIDDLPVIFISAYGREDLIARAFDMGADDYVVKPFSPVELDARIRSALRRREAPEPPQTYAHGDLVVDFAERRVTLAGRRLSLVAMEYRLLAELAANAGRVLTYEHLLKRVWNDRDGGDIRPMRTIVSKLRRKLGDDADNPTYLFTEPRVGYRMPAGEGAESDEA